MIDAPRRRLTQAIDRLERLAREQWLAPEDAVAIRDIERASPGDLFSNDASRPLVVGLYGGTGVGKSSLLNRLAGQALARTGVERPTSREVTLYAHQGIALASLPPDLPIEKTRVVRHREAAWQELVWIDAPDIDSTAVENRELTLAWAPHIDLIVYVVSPERYRDDVGWRVLRERGGRHGWMFVLNRWDEGHSRQADDLAGILTRAGFDAPLIFRTSCADPPRACPSPDEFAEIQAAMKRLLAEHGAAELDRLGWRARLRDAQAICRTCAARLGDAPAWTRLRTAIASRLDSTTATIRDGLEFRIQALAADLAAQRQQPRASLIDAAKSMMAGRSDDRNANSSPAANTAVAPLSADADDGLTARLNQFWDDWAQSKLAQTAAAIEVEADRCGLPSGAVRRSIEVELPVAGQRIADAIQQPVRRALAAPGTRMQRALRVGTGFLCAALPIAAVIWVGVTLIGRFHAASNSSAAFLGTDFAIHSGLLVLAAWLVPFLFDVWLRPSIAKSTARAVRDGLGAGLSRVREDWLGGIDQTAQDAAARRAEIEEQAAQLSLDASTDGRPVGPTLARIVASPNAVETRAASAAR